MARLELAREAGQIEAGVDGIACGSPDGLFHLGLQYCAGREVGINLVEAHKWFNLAAMRGNEAAKRYRLEISREMNKAQIAHAQRLAREWLRAH